MTLFNQKAYAEWLHNCSNNEILCDIDCIDALETCESLYHSSFVDDVGPLKEILLDEVCRRFRAVLEGI